MSERYIPEFENMQSKDEYFKYCNKCWEQMRKDGISRVVVPNEEGYGYSIEKLPDMFTGWYDIEFGKGKFYDEWY